MELPVAGPRLVGIGLPHEVALVGSDCREFGV